MVLIIIVIIDSITMFGSVLVLRNSDWTNLLGTFLIVKQIEAESKDYIYIPFSFLAYLKSLLIICFSSQTLSFSSLHLMLFIMKLWCADILSNAQVEGDGRLVPATDDEVMEVKDLLVDEKSEVCTVADVGQPIGCISNDRSSPSMLPQLESSEGPLPLPFTVGSRYFL